MQEEKNSAYLQINKPGPLCTVQDLGRKNCQHLGLNSGGAADLYAYNWANHLLDNPRGAACLEITLGPCEIVFNHTTRIALCGALSNATVGAKQLLPWGSYDIYPGDILRIPIAQRGLRFYLAVKGGILTEHHFSSRSSMSMDGSIKALAAGTKLAYPLVEDASKTLKQSAHWNSIPDYQKDLVLRVHPSYQYQLFSDSCKSLFFNSIYELSPQCNRMGYRLKGQPLDWKYGGIVSEGIAYGAIQIPPDGQPIVLLNDRQTIGGYPKIGCIVREDAYQLAQRRPGQKVKFELLVNRKIDSPALPAIF